MASCGPVLTAEIPRSRRLWVSFGMLTLAGLAVLLLGDATSSVLMPRTPRRAMGCYTALELLAGVSEPSWIRPAELIVGFFLLGVVLRRVSLGVLHVVSVAWAMRRA